MKTTFILILFAALGFYPGACQPCPCQSPVSSERISCGPGPEDMVLDTLNGEARLLLSCCARREEHGSYGEIESLNLNSHEHSVLTRFGEPDSLLFQPHGIHLHGGRLYVISHEREPDRHPILIYRLLGDSLVFEERICSSSQHSPNALVAGDDGDIYFVNDSGKRGSLWEKALKLKRANIVRLRKNDKGKWESTVVAEKLSYPAGIIREDSLLFAGDARLNQIHCYGIRDEGLVPGKPIKGLKGNDNLRLYKDFVLTSCHSAPLRFIQHVKNAEKLSPVRVCLVRPKSGETRNIFHTDGSLISGASTAILYKKQLYLCQIFETFVLKVEMEE